MCNALQLSLVIWEDLCARLLSYFVGGGYGMFEVLSSDGVWTKYAWSVPQVRFGNKVWGVPSSMRFGVFHGSVSSMRFGEFHGSVSPMRFRAFRSGFIIHVRESLRLIVDLVVG